MLNPLNSNNNNNPRVSSGPWRHYLAYVYMLVTIFDFIIFPILWAIFTAKRGELTSAWSPLTLMGGGLFHLSFGAILGVSANAKAKEKIANWEVSASLEEKETTAEKARPRKYYSHEK